MSVLEWIIFGPLIAVVVSFFVVFWFVIVGGTIYFVIRAPYEIYCMVTGKCTGQQPGRRPIPGTHFTPKPANVVKPEPTPNPPGRG